MSDIRRYVLVDADDTELDYEYDSFNEASAAASTQGCAVIARIYEYSDSELVWTPNGEEQWPPEDPRYSL